MKNTLLILLLVGLTSHVVSAQCNGYITKGSEIFHANDIRTVINSAGDMFWDLSNSRFQVPYTGLDSPGAIFAASVWIGGFDDVGNLKVAAPTYRDNFHQDYLSGPLTQVGIPFDDNCGNWDTIWSVTRNDILLHLQDYNADGVVDNPVKSVFGWPGIKNPFFEQVNGFPMPELVQGFYHIQYAPFFDRDSDGVYEPQHGEYPLPQHLDETTIPDQITWNIFNDARVHTASQGDPLRFEIQQTTYAFYCQESPLLNRTLFIDFNIVNRATSILDSVYFALWMDADLGCYMDDFIGSSPENNTFMVYNSDSIDGPDCEKGYFATPPVLSVSFPDRTLTSFMYYANASVGSWPNAMTDPQSGAPLEFYRFMSGSWKDGTPLTYGGTGYFAGPAQITSHAFPGNPNESTSWALTNEPTVFADRRTVASTYLTRLDPGQSTVVSIAFALHLDTNLNHLQNVELMYQQLPYLHSQFANSFSDCIKSLTPCDEDCVWPGDANNDGIANHYDILQLGLAYGKSGPKRNAPISWAPHQGDSWSETFANGLNIKFADMNGDGVVAHGSELDVLEVHYGNTHGDYQEVLSCNEGNTLIVEGGFELYSPSSFRTITEIRLNPDAIDSLYGIAFTVLYDTSYFIRAVSPLTETPFEMASEFVNFERPGMIEYAATRSDGINQSMFEESLLLRFLFLYNNIDQKPGQHDTSALCIANIRGTLVGGTEIPLGANKIQFIFLDENVTGASDINAQGISVYPNPSNGLIQFEVPLSLIGAHYEIRQMSGQLTSSVSITSEITQLDLAAGVYVLSIRRPDRLFVEKIVVLD